MKRQHARKRLRLQEYDYSQAGAYFVTAVTQQRQYLFGEVHNEQVILSAIGTIAQTECQAIATYWSRRVEIDTFVVMPNHVHLIIFLVGAAFLRPELDKSPTLGQIMTGYKAGVVRKCRQQSLLDDTASVWQRGFHDHIIRNEHEYQQIAQYVMTNPPRWDEDSLNTW